MTHEVIFPPPPQATHIKVPGVPPSNLPSPESSPSLSEERTNAIRIYHTCTLFRSAFNHLSLAQLCNFRFAIRFSNARTVYYLGCRGCAELHLYDLFYPNNLYSHIILTHHTYIPVPFHLSLLVVTYSEPQVLYPLGSINQIQVEPRAICLSLAHLAIARLSDHAKR